MNKATEDAHELIIEFYSVIPRVGDFKQNWKCAQQCAELCVNKLISEHSHEEHDSDMWSHWVNVKQEIFKK